MNARRNISIVLFSAIFSVAILMGMIVVQFLFRSSWFMNNDILEFVGTKSWVVVQVFSFLIVFMVISSIFINFLPVITKWVARDKSHVSESYTSEKIAALLSELISKSKEYESNNKKLEAIAIAKSRMLREVIDIVPLFIFAKDEEGKFFLINRAYAACYGATPRQMYGKTDADFNSDAKEVAKFSADDMEVLRSGQPKYRIEDRITCVSGQTKTVITNKIPFYTPDCKPAVLGISTDITPNADTYKRVMKDIEDLFIESAHCDFWHEITDRMQKLYKDGYHN